jgi:hypothetical protein
MALLQQLLTYYKLLAFMQGGACSCLCMPQLQHQAQQSSQSVALAAAGCDNKGSSKFQLNWVWCLLVCCCSDMIANDIEAVLVKVCSSSTAAASAQQASVTSFHCCQHVSSELADMACQTPDITLLNCVARSLHLAYSRHTTAAGAFF